MKTIILIFISIGIFYLLHYAIEYVARRVAAEILMMSNT